MHSEIYYRFLRWSACSFRFLQREAEEFDREANGERGQRFFHPKVNERSQHFHSSVDTLHAWGAEKAKRMKEERQRQEREARAKSNPAHYMSEGTRRLVEQFDRTMPVHDMLIAQVQ